MVNADVVNPVLDAFRSLFEARFPIHRMELVDEYGADDERSTLADNTSGFNCRLVPGSDVWSQHAYGRAVDINPFENPEVRDGSVDPPAASRFTETIARRAGNDPSGRRRCRGLRGDRMDVGRLLGHAKDYQHFSLTGT